MIMTIAAMEAFGVQPGAIFSSATHAEDDRGKAGAPDSLSTPTIRGDGGYRLPACGRYLLCSFELHGRRRLGVQPGINSIPAS
jgi:hypothetical protein